MSGAVPMWKESRKQWKGNGKCSTAGLTGEQKGAEILLQRPLCSQNQVVAPYLARDGSWLYQPAFFGVCVCESYKLHTYKPHSQHISMYQRPANSIAFTVLGEVGLRAKEASSLFG